MQRFGTIDAIERRRAGFPVNCDVTSTPFAAPNDISKRSGIMRRFDIEAIVRHSAVQSVILAIA